MFGGLQEFFLSSKAKALAPAVASRMFHYRGAQAKQGLFRYERWIPGRWKGLHDAYAEAVQRDVARVKYSVNPQGPPDQQFSAEEEYLQILLLQKVMTGNLTPAQVEAVASWLRGCAHALALSPPPLEGDGFWLDLGLGDGLLIRKPQSAQGPVLYLDIAPLHTEMEKTMAALDRLVSSAPMPQQKREAAAQLELLRRIDPLLHPNARPVERRGERVATDRAATVAVGLAEIAAALHSSRTEAQLIAASKRFRQEGSAEPSPGSPDLPLKGHSVEVIDYRSYEVTGQTGWWLHDTSDSGRCLVSNAQEAARQKLGGVLGIQEEGDNRWKIGIVRRMTKLSGGRIEMGVEIIALHSLLISPKPITEPESGDSVDAADVITDNRGFDALYLPPNSSGRSEPRRSMLVPASQYVERRRLFLRLGSTAYTVELSAPLEQAKDWVWTQFAVVSRTDEVRSTAG
jgi:hypothetical protein